MWLALTSASPGSLYRLPWVDAGTRSKLGSAGVLLKPDLFFIKLEIKLIILLCCCIKLYVLGL